MRGHPASCALIPVLAFLAPLLSSETGLGRHISPQSPVWEYVLLATSKTSTMEKELNESAKAGFRFEDVMGGETAFGGNEVVAVMSREDGGEPGRYEYRLLATSRTGTMQREAQEAADAGFRYVGQTVFQSLFGGKEVVLILERDRELDYDPYEVRLLATTRTGTMQRELQEAGADGYEFVGFTVATTAFGGDELVSIMRRSTVRPPQAAAPAQPTPEAATPEAAKVEPAPTSEPATATSSSGGGIASGALPPLTPIFTAPLVASKSASWTGRTAEGVAYEWSVVVSNDNGEPMKAIALVALRDSAGAEIHTATGQADVAANSTVTLSGTGTVENDVAVNADHWTFDVTWAPEGVGGADEIPSVAEETRPVAMAEPSTPLSAATDSQTVQSPEPQVAETLSVRLSVDLVAEQARITNTSRSNINLRGWELVSVTGNQRIKIVIGILPPGGSLIVTSGPRARDSPGYYIWTRGSIWDINGDPAELYDPQGNLRASTNPDGSPRR